MNPRVEIRVSTLKDGYYKAISSSKPDVLDLVNKTFVLGEIFIISKTKYTFKRIKALNTYQSNTLANTQRFLCQIQRQAKHSLATYWRGNVQKYKSKLQGLNLSGS
jgi:hypothetical protein